MSERRDEILNGVTNEVEYNDWTFLEAVGGDVDEQAIVDLVMRHVDPLLKEIEDLTDTEFEPGRWWRVLDPQGGIWCETSDEAEARSVMRKGDRLERLWDAKPQSRWRRVRPTREKRKKSQ